MTLWHDCKTKLNYKLRNFIFSNFGTQIGSYSWTVPYIVQYQVLPSDLGDPDSDEWGGWRRKGQNSYNIATQVSMIMYAKVVIGHI